VQGRQARQKSHKETREEKEENERAKVRRLGELTELRSSRRFLRSLTVAPLLAVTAVAFSAAPALATTLLAEEPKTETAASVTGTSAILEGTLNPHSSAKVGGYFAYSAPNGMTCLEGPTAGLEEFEEKEGEAIAVHGAVGLEPDRTYQVCLVATNEAGEPTVGQPVGVTTPAIAPNLEVYGVSSVGPSSAHLEAVFNANNEEVTNCEYEYGTSPTLATGTKKVPCEQELSSFPAVYAGQLASVSVAGLAASTQYYFRLVAANPTGASGVSPETPIETFTTGTPEPPIYEGENATPKAKEAMLEATINPNYQETSYKFEYSTKASGEPLALEDPITVDGAPPAAKLAGEFVGDAVSVSTGAVLTPNTTYYYRVIATNATPPATEGPVAEFTTAITPEVPSGEKASAITGTTARLEGVVNPLSEGNPGTYEFLYRQSAHECQGGTPEEDKVTSQEGTAGAAGEEAKASLTGLETKDDYTFCLLSRNGVGETAVGAPVTFETGVIVPTEVETGNVEDITTTSATFGGGELNPGGEAKYFFEYGTALCGPSTCGTATAESTLTGRTEQAIGSASVTGLQTGTIYHYRLVVRNGVGTTHGEAKVFRTSATPAEEAAEGAARAKPEEELAGAIAAQTKAEEETRKQDEAAAASAAAASKLYNELAAETTALGTPKLVPVPKTTTAKPKPVKCKKTQMRKGKKCVKKPKKKKRAHTSRRTNR
jgi:hypothetical protein